jgi:hypothetical protein
MVADLDYSLGWFLPAIAKAGTPAGPWLFKGGACQRKCCFEDYRFSEDLDFTATAFISPEALVDGVERATRWAADHDGPDFAAAPARLEVIEDEYGSESYQVRVYYRGPLRWGGSPRAIRLDATRDEQALWPPAHRPLIHPNSDIGVLEPVELTCYGLEEMLAEIEGLLEWMGQSPCLARPKQIGRLLPPSRQRPIPPFGPGLFQGFVVSPDDLPRGRHLAPG